MKFSDYLRRFPEVHLTNTEIAFCHFLERRGQRFQIDFGYENAFEKAMDLLDVETVLLEVV